MELKSLTFSYITYLFRFIFFPRVRFFWLLLGISLLQTLSFPVRFANLKTSQMWLFSKFFIWKEGSLPHVDTGPYQIIQLERIKALISWKCYGKNFKKFILIIKYCLKYIQDIRKYLSKRNEKFTYTPILRYETHGTRKKHTEKTAKIIWKKYFFMTFDQLPSIHFSKDKKKKINLLTFLYVV